MKRVPITVLPGTNPTPDATELETLHYTDTDKVYFSKNADSAEHFTLRKLPGWISVIFSNEQTIRGAARSMFSYIYNISHTLIGTSSRLYTYENGALYNITPLLTSTTAIADSIATDYVSLASNPITTVSGSKMVTITSTAHKIMTGDSVKIAGVSGAVNGIPDTELNSTFYVRQKTVNNFTIMVPTTTASGSGSGGGGSVIASTGILRITANAHGLMNGDRIKINAAASTGGVPDTEINIEHIIRSVATNTFDVVTGTIATSAVSAGGGASTTYQKPIQAGAINYSPGLGYGGGLYGAGLYGVAKAFVSTYTYPRIWSFGRFGNDIIVAPGNGGKIYIWENDINEAPTILSGAPTAVDWVFVSSNAVVALYQNRIQASDVGDATNWTVSAATNAYDDTIEGVGKFISQASVGNTNLLFTENEVFLFSFVGKPNIWDTRDFVKSDGLIAPYARAVVNETVYWTGQAGDIYSTDGGSLNKIPNYTCHDWVNQNINRIQRFKTFCRVDTSKNQIWWIFATGVTVEPNKYLIYDYKDGHFTLGNISRTAAESPIATADSPYMINSTSESADGSLFRHNYGFNDDLEPMSVYAATNYAMIGEGDNTMEIMEVIPNSTQVGNVDLTIYTKDHIQSTEEFEYGPFVITPTTLFIDPQAAGRQRKYVIEQNGADEDLIMALWFENIQQGTPL